MRYDSRRVAEEKATQQATEKLEAALRSKDERRIDFALTVVARLTGKAPAELREEAKHRVAHERLVRAAAEASERFGDDECEHFAEMLRRGPRL